MDLAEREWAILHRDYERYERTALVIKLLAVTISLVCWMLALGPFIANIFILVLWLQEGIWKTYQARIGARLLSVEKMLVDPPTDQDQPFQLYSVWTENRKGGLRLVAEYVANSLRPTVAFPYVVLLLATLASDAIDHDVAV